MFYILHGAAENSDRRSTGRASASVPAVRAWQRAAQAPARGRLRRRRRRARPRGRRRRRGEDRGPRAGPRGAGRATLHAVVVVRVNGADTRIADDLQAVVTPDLDCVMVPKVEDPPLLARARRAAGELEDRPASSGHDAVLPLDRDGRGARERRGDRAGRGGASSRSSSASPTSRVDLGVDLTPKATSSSTRARGSDRRPRGRPAPAARRPVPRPRGRRGPRGGLRRSRGLGFQGRDRDLPGAGRRRAAHVLRELADEEARAPAGASSRRSSARRPRGSPRSRSTAASSTTRSTIAHAASSPLRGRSAARTRPCRSTPLPLDGLKVVDAATLFAGPVIATIMGDYGADVIKVEHPRGDNLRTLGWAKDGVSLWWALVGRNKRCGDAQPVAPARAGAPAASSCRRRRLHRELPARDARALEPRARRCSASSTRAS